MTSPFLLSTFAVTVALLATGPTAAQTEPSHHHADRGTMDMQTPASLKAEHRQLHEVLALAFKEKGEMGRAAGELESALAPHFRREEEIATPPLGLLELPQMLKEHEGIREAVGKFRAATEKAGRADYVRFSDELAADARQEEEILYPAAVLVGRYVKRAAPEK